MRVVKVDPAALADGMFLIGQAWIKYGAGDHEGADADVDAAADLLPRQGIEAILFMIEAGDLPTPGPEPGAMEAWLEECRQAGAGELRMKLGYMPVTPPPDRPESEAEFIMRLAQKYATGSAPPPVTSLADELRAMGLM
jgi:hypothetical protein